jgi:hypothetical protein
MLNLLHNKQLPEAFNITEEERRILIELINQVVQNKGVTTLTWAIERVWIDERFSDNLRAYSMFLLGYAYANERR